MASKAQRLRTQLQNTRRRARERKQATTRKASGAVTAYAIGKAEETGAMNSIPRLFGMPRTVTAGVAATLGSMFVGGVAGEIMEGIGEGSLNVAAYQFGRGLEISGADPYLVGAGDPLADVEAALEEQLAAEEAEYL